MKITVVGGGNIGTLIAVHGAEKGHDVTILTSTPNLFETNLRIVNEKDVVIHEGVIVKATNDPKDAYSEADYILVTLPANMVKQCADDVFKYAPKTTVIGVVPGNGGTECMFRKSICRGNTFFLMERVPSIARLVKRGSSVKSTGYKDELRISTIPASEAEKCRFQIQSLFDIPCKVIPGLLNLTMTPSNPILHTTRLKSMFKDYHEGVVYDQIPLFYEEWDNDSSSLLLACDEEVQMICRALPELHLDYVKPLSIYYESPTPEKLTQKLSGIAAFKGIGTPSVKVDGGFIPDLNSRYFTADFSYGLAVIQQIGSFAGVLTPNIDETMNWYQNLAQEVSSFNYSDYGICSREDFIDFYIQ